MVKYFLNGFFYFKVHLKRRKRLKTWPMVSYIQFKHLILFTFECSIINIFFCDFCSVNRGVKDFQFYLKDQVFKIKNVLKNLLSQKLSNFFFKGWVPGSGRLGNIMGIPDVSIPIIYSWLFLLFCYIS